MVEVRDSIRDILFNQPIVTLLDSGEDGGIMVFISFSLFLPLSLFRFLCFAIVLPFPSFPHCIQIFHSSSHSGKYISGSPA